MKIESKQSYAIVSTTIRDINNREMQQMHELKNRINDVLDSHKPDSKEKKYVSDDDLQLMRAILSVFTKEYESTQTSAFDDFLKEQEKPVEKPQQQSEKKPIRLPDDDLYGGE